MINREEAYEFFDTALVTSRMSDGLLKKMEYYSSGVKFLNPDKYLHIDITLTNSDIKIEVRVDIDEHIDTWRKFRALYEKGSHLRANTSYRTREEDYRKEISYIFCFDTLDDFKTFVTGEIV